MSKEKFLGYFAIMFFSFSVFMLFISGFYKIFLPVQQNGSIYVNFYVPDTVEIQTLEYDQAYRRLLNFEGTYSFDIDDPGKETFCGISRVYFPNWQGWQTIDKLKKTDIKFSEAIKNKIMIKHLDSLVKDFYYKEFWLPMNCKNLPKTLAFELFEQSVNLGHKQTIFHLQVILNTLNYKKIYGKVIAEDGKPGKDTWKMLDVMLSANNEVSIINGVNSLQGAYYITKARESNAKKKFMNGWLSKRVNFDKVWEG